MLIKKGLPQQAPLVFPCVWSFESGPECPDIFGGVLVEDGFIGEAGDHVAEALDLLAGLAHVDDAESVFEGLELEFHGVGCV
jgi:hypothetical protein